MSSSSGTAPFDHTGWKIFTCENLFEPPVIYLPGEEDKKPKPSFASINLIRSTVAGRVNPYPLAQAFLAGAAPLFENSSDKQIHDVDQTVAALKKIFDEAQTPEFQIVRAWLDSHSSTIKKIIAERHIQSMLTYLSIDLMSYFDDNKGDEDGGDAGGGGDEESSPDADGKLTHTAKPKGPQRRAPTRK
jgi:hypothetical protein